MCGIFGYYNLKQKTFTKNKDNLFTLMIASYSRGKEAAGMSVLEPNNHLSYIKSDLNCKKILKEDNFKNLITKVNDKEVVSVIGHSRLATHGSQLDAQNNQPVINDNKSLIGVHNGIITNTDVLWESIGETGTPPTLDSKVLNEYICHQLKSQSIELSLKKTYEKIEGTASIAFLNANNNTLFLATNTGSVYYVFNKEKETFFFASEYIFIAELCESLTVNESEIKQLKPKNAIILNQQDFNLIDLKNIQTENEILLNTDSTFKIKDYSNYELKSNAKKHYKVVNSIDKIRTHTFDYERIHAIKRCKKCILPITTPFLTLNSEGVCNYCTDHKKITYKGVDKLKKLVKKYKTKDGRPNCLAAFSGGRDSSYGLHFLKNELGLEPLAYTYDWGMITDLGRKNQARMLGDLGIEHILVSADITKKRKHINENIRAWMKDPHLGMVPLFMQGDKQCEFYADQIMKKYDIKLMFFFRGNELEIDEFKTGHSGVKDADPGGVIHNLAPLKKLKMLLFYGWRYLKNPSYFNSSFWDTSLAYFATYIQKHNYLFLWHYVPWKEKEILSTLKDNYNWETSKHTSSTWRTDDGTAAFYNYIYYQVQGFTENDSFRSRQIREGRLDRETALKLVNEENKPRYESLTWYFDMVGLDGDEVLTVVDNMKKLY